MLLELKRRAAYKKDEANLTIRVSQLQNILSEGIARKKNAE